MELWIRNQAKNKLLKVKCMEIKEFEEGYGIVELINSNECYGLGIYKTKERALEVLDDIQRTLLPRGILENNDDNDYKFVFHNWNTIYEMPEN